ncbi:MAG: Bacterial SH3 domain protein [Pelotomaculum sp. PtaB.Bin013]|nr:MAG: Bacterial SH3 domain protein [Pelotomaculum sp. PtaB.Bin013]
MLLAGVLGNVWFWALIANAIITAIFLIIALAYMEAGGKAKSKWLTLTFCSLVVMVSLIIMKPKPNKEEVQYLPVSPAVTENVDKQKDTAPKKSAANSTSSTGSSSGEKSQSTSGKNQGTQGQTKVSQEKNGGESGTNSTTENKKTAPTIQDQLNDSLKKKSNDNIYKDPVLEEILDLKQRAEEGGEETASEELPENSSEQQPGGAGSSAEGQKDVQNTDTGSRKDLIKQLSSQKVVKAKVLVSSLNVRDKGSMDGNVIGLLNTGDIVEVIDNTVIGEWVNVKLNSGQKGWVIRKNLEILQ